MSTATLTRPTTKTKKEVLYVFTIAGQYYTTGAPRGENVKEYECDVPMSEEDVNDKRHSPLSLFRHFYAHRLMPKKYPDYTGLFTFEIRKAQCSDPRKLRNNIKVMNFHQLTRYIREEELPVKVELYEDAGSLRSAIALCEKDREGFVKQQRITSTRKGPAVRKQERADTLIEQYAEEFTRSNGKIKLQQAQAPNDEDDDEDEYDAEEHEDSDLLNGI
jgi:hypothetical protein